MAGCLRYIGPSRGLSSSSSDPAASRPRLESADTSWSTRYAEVPTSDVAVTEELLHLIARIAQIRDRSPRPGPDHFGRRRQTVRIITAPTQRYVATVHRGVGTPRDGTRLDFPQWVAAERAAAG